MCFGLSLKSVDLLLESVDRLIGLIINRLQRKQICRQADSGFHKFKGVSKWNLNEKHNSFLSHQKTFSTLDAFNETTILRLYNKSTFKYLNFLIFKYYVTQETFNQSFILY